MDFLESPVVVLGNGEQGPTILSNVPLKEIPPAVQKFLDELPIKLNPFLPTIILSKPDDGRFYAFVCIRGAYAIWLNHLHIPYGWENRRYRDRMLPVQNQGRHSCCWSIMDAEHVSEARHIHKIDKKLTAYSGQYLLDSANPVAAKKRYIETKGEHYCYGYPGFKGLQFAMNNGMPTRDDYTYGGCTTGKLPPKCDARLHHVLNDVRCFTDANKIFKYLKIQPIRGSVAVFHPDFSRIDGGIYRGPTKFKSKFTAWHAVTLCDVFTEGEETIALVKNCHGTKRGVEGFYKISLDVMIYGIGEIGKSSFPTPTRLFRSFCYGEVREEYQKEVVEVYTEEQKVDHRASTSEYMTFLILEGIFHNTSGNVFLYEDGQEEIIGSPIDRALFKWALKLEKNFMSIKSESVVIRDSQHKKKCQGISVKCLKTKMSGIRVHWKGNARYILENCTQYALGDNSVEMSDEERALFSHAIDGMAARNLICVAFAYKEIEGKNVPRELPCKNLVMLAIVGIKDPCPPLGDDEIRAPLDFEVEVEDKKVMVEEENGNEAATLDKFPRMLDEWRKELKELHEDSELDDEDDDDEDEDEVCLGEVYT